MSFLSARIKIGGQVQGIGFRPFVFRLARAMGIRGSIANTGNGVVIIAQGERVKEFINRLRTRPPPLAKIGSFDISYIKTKCYKTFAIIKSADKDRLGGVDVLPDLNTCPDCRKELFNPKDRRWLYPFINCTQCGPRYSIIELLPYDRDKTTMRRFKMCPACENEYLDPLNRRFHAEPIACPVCGPELVLINKNGKRIKTKQPILTLTKRIIAGKVVAIKGLGGFHLACDATNDQAVHLLRQHKGRDSKPLALMAGDLKTVRAICHLNQRAEKLLLSAAVPIVLLPKKQKPGLAISPLVAPNNPAIGIMLPYTPLHLLIFHILRQLLGSPPVLVMTSANRHNEPIVTTDRDLFREIKGGFSCAISHNREIANRCDDSVVFADNQELIMIRRARGYAPQPINLSDLFHVKHPTLAVGGDTRNAFALARGNRLFLSPHVGDLESAQVERFFLNTLDRLGLWTGVVPERVVCDLHPDYRSVRLAERLAERWRVPLYRVQHHYAHIISVMAEHGLQGPVLGVACDGTGYGVDGAIWGCEFILVKKDLSWAKVGGLGNLRHNAGAGMVADPVRVAAAYCLQSGIEKGALRRLGICFEELGWTEELPVLTSSLGRLFDAVAAITGVCRRATFEGEAAIALEDAATRLVLAGKIPKFKTKPIQVSQSTIDPRPVIQGVVELTLAGYSAGAVAYWFHRIMARLLATSVTYLAENLGIKTVCISGGSFQNNLLRRGVKSLLAKKGVVVYQNELVPINDGGIAAGQAVVPVY